ncbi:hypothetical protein SOASR031_18210 [Leminorella grimontii]|nr:hypothetical protein SOASR031_18210 [Leminorella grimontii]
MRNEQLTANYTRIIGKLTRACFDSGAYPPNNSPIEAQMDLGATYFGDKTGKAGKFTGSGGFP